MPSTKHAALVLQAQDQGKRIRAMRMPEAVEAAAIAVMLLKELRAVAVTTQRRDQYQAVIDAFMEAAEVEEVEDSMGSLYIRCKGAPDA